MQLRVLTTKGERRIFTERLAEARARHETGLEDTPATIAYNRKRLLFADIYALFKGPDDLPEQMIAGVALHDLETFPQSCARPNLAHIPPRQVLECSDHWSLSCGAGVHAWRGIALQVVYRAPRAVLIYLAVRGADHSGFYRAMGFAPAGDPVEYPHLRRSDNARLLVQPMILEGSALARLTESVLALKFEAADDFRVVRFEKSDRLRPAIRRDSALLHCANPSRHLGNQAVSQSIEI
jgi:hypothetical protein